MAEVKISALTAATGLTDDDVLIVNDGATTKKITAANALSRTLHPVLPISGSIGASPATYDVASAGKYRYWSQLFVGEYPVATAQAGWIMGGITYLSELTNCDAISYRTHTAKASGLAHFCVYELDENLLPTGAPVWSHQLASATVTGDVTETGLTPFSFTGGWYFLAVWNPDDGGGNFGYRALTPAVPGGAPFDPNTADELGLFRNHGGTGGPPTFAGTENWVALATGFPSIGVLDSTT